MDLESTYEISRTAGFIIERGFSCVALQFPDELLKDSARVAKALKEELGKGVRLYVLADTAYGSCCVDEVGASHVDAQCVVHYGHACMSPTSTLPALFVFGKAYIDINCCAASLHQCLKGSNKPILVLYGLEYVHALVDIKACVNGLLHMDGTCSPICYAEITCSIKEPLGDHLIPRESSQSHDTVAINGELLACGDERPVIELEHKNKLEYGTMYYLGGLSWNVPAGQRVKDYTLFWIGPDNSAFANIVLTFNSCNIVRFDANEGRLLEDFAHVKRILRHRYYLVEKSKDANIVGVLVGTLGVAGYLHMIEKMKELIEEAGKKSYIIVMGRPNSAKLANFPECDVFVYLSCAQTALMDSKEYLAPVITPFEAILAFSRGRQWTGEYMTKFPELFDFMASKLGGIADEEARFSFLKGGYVEDNRLQENSSSSGQAAALELAEVTGQCMSLREQSKDAILFEGASMSAAEYLLARSYRGLDQRFEQPPPSSSYLVGRTGRAASYESESRQE